jgi:hypothetical protein
MPRTLSAEGYVRIPVRRTEHGRFGFEFPAASCQAISMRLRALLFFAIGISGTVTLLADRDDRDHNDRRRRGRVTFFEHADFRGGSITLEVGDSVENLAGVPLSNGVSANDRISSVQIDGPVEVTVYRDARYRGEKLRLLRDVRNLAQGAHPWNDMISSIRVEYRRPGADREEQARMDQQIERAYRDVLQRAADTAGLRSYRTRLIEDNWNEEDVRNALRKTEEYRSVVSRIVAKAYREILGRDPDSEGAHNYSEHMLRDRWTEEDVRDSLKKSEEARNRGRRNGG